MERAVLVLDKKFENKIMYKTKTINNCSKKIFVFSIFFFTLVASFLFFDVFREDNKAKAEVCSSPVDVMMVIDKSGSMSELVDGEQKIEVAKSAALSFVDSLNSNDDQIGLEVFANSAALFDPGLTDNFGLIDSRINSISFEEGGQTNTEAAIVLARGELINDGRGTAIKVMVILSDGVPNRQISTGDPIAKAIVAADIAKENGIRIISIGFLDSLDEDFIVAEDFMKTIASAPGDYYSSNNSPSCGEANYLVCIYNQISASICDNIFPVITEVSKNRVGTLYAQDDLIIVSQISDDFGIKEHEIKWSINGWVTENTELCTVSAGTTNTCEKNIGTFGEGTIVSYKSYVVDTNDNGVEGTENGEGTSKSVRVASSVLEINGDVNGKFQRNQDNTIKINISDPQGMANSDEFYVSVDSIAVVGGVEFNKQLMSNCVGTGSNLSCSNDLFSPACDTDDSVNVYVYPKSTDIGYHNYAITKSVDSENIEEDLSSGTCSDLIDNDCDGKTDLVNGIEESECDNVAPVVNIKRKVSEVEVVDVYSNDSVTLSSTAVDYPTGLNGLISHTIYWYKNGVFQGEESCGSAVNCEKVIGIFPAGTEIEYYAKAIDNSGNNNTTCGPAGCATYHNFVVKDLECDGQTDLTGCSGGAGACCNGICDTPQDSNLFDSECSTSGCSGNNWGWVANNENGDCMKDEWGCYDVVEGSGCEERNYSCSSGSCSPVISDAYSDTCAGLTLNDYGCNALQCELLSSVNDPSCDSELESISIVATDNELSVISSGGDVLDSKTNQITFTSSASDTYNIIQHKIFWTDDNWISTNEIDCGGSESCSGPIGPLSIGTVIKYYSRAVDENSESGETSHYSFTVIDSSCYSASDMTSCTIGGNSGKCCNSLCDISFDSTTLYDTECMVQGCNAESWEYVSIVDGASCNAAGEDACFAYFSGCEKRDYSCATGLCTYTSVTTDTDVCSGDTFVDFGCSGGNCSSGNDDCSDCSCNCGSYNLDEKIYSALSFDGVNDYVNIPNNSNLNPATAITIEGWVKLTESLNCNSNNNWRSLLHKGSVANTSTGYDIVLEQGGNFTWDIGSTDSIRYYGSGSSLQVDEWTFVTFIYDSSVSQAEIYFNGIEITGVYWNSGSGFIKPNTGTLYINNPSASCSSGSGNFPGLINEVRIYNRALADDEVLQHYQGVYQDESGLVGYWKLDDEGGVALDSSGNGNNGNLVNGSTWVTSFDNANNVPSYWRTCSDLKNNDCDLDIDANDSGCDGEFTSLDISAKYGASLENTIPNNGDIYRSDIGTLKLISTAFDSIFGVNAHSILWRAGGVDQTPNNCGASGSCEISVGDFPAGTVVEYKSFASDTNNNSACDPVDCSSYYSFTVRDLECYDIDTGADIDGICESGTGECCGGACDTSFDDSNLNGYDTDCKVVGCSGESWEWIPEGDSTSCNAASSNLCSIFSINGCETTNYECSSGFCENNPINQKTDYCYDDYKFKDFGCDTGNCEGTDINCKLSCDSGCCCSCGSYNLDEKIYSSLSFDGSDDYININDSTDFNFGTSSVSFEFWFKLNESFTSSSFPVLPIISKYKNGDYNYYIALYGTEGNNNSPIDGSIVFKLENSPKLIYVSSSTTSWNANEWYHIVVTRTGADVDIYVNGADNNEIIASSNGQFADFNQIISDYKIGGGSIDQVGGESRYFNGFIDVVRIYNRVLEDYEVLQHYQGVYQNESGLVGHWKFDDTITSSTVIDSSGNGNNGTLINGPTWAESFNDFNKNNVPTYWQACTDNKDNDCNGQKDSTELTCDGEFDVLSIQAKDGNGSILGDGDEVKDIDTDKISLIATPFDFDSGVKEVTIYWTVDGVSSQKTCGYGGGDDPFEGDGTCLAEIPDTGQLSAGTIVEYKVQGLDNNNNSKCNPSDCISSNSFSVILSNIAPVISELRKQQNESYCNGLDNVSFLWTYYDEDAVPNTNTQNLYEIQMKKGGVSDDPFVSGFFDSGLFLDISKDSQTHSYLYNSNDTENNQDFEYNSTYYWRARAKDIKGTFSDWVVYDDSSDNDGNGYTKSFSTPLHRYPDPDFDFLPISPDFGEEITITDGSTAYDFSGNSNADLIKKWDWDFDGDITIDKTINRTIEILNGDTTHVYLNPTINQYSIKLTVTDNDDFVCYKIKQINIATGEEYPRWNEIAPSN